MQLGDDEILLADDPGLEAFKFDALAAAVFGEAIFGLLADDAIHLDVAFPVEEIEERLLGDGAVHRLAREVVVGLEQTDHDLGVGGAKR